MLLSIFLVIISFFFMEFMAWFTHKYVMHGFLWSLHKDHHIRDGRKVEKNDWFAIFFSVPGILLIIFGTLPQINPMFYIGIGISLYGMAYFLFHDIYVHQRLKLFTDFSNRYLRATVKAHQEHHIPHNHRNYGFLLAPLKYYKEEFKKHNS